jgi:His-Xaa-Ser system protein HxsD
LKKERQLTAEGMSWLEEVTEESLRISVDTSLYTKDALFKACYAFTDRCYLFLSPAEAPDVVRVRFSRKEPGTDLAVMAGEFANELVDQRVRAQIAAETAGVRELIVAQAFAEADLIDRTLPESSYEDDPRGIAG